MRRLFNIYNFLILIFPAVLCGVDFYIADKLPQEFYPSSLNSSGTVAGYVNRQKHFQPIAAVWNKDLGVTTLGEFTDVESRATDINDRGEVIGYIYARQPNGVEGPHWSFRWRPSEDNLTIAPREGSAVAVNNHGDVVGNRPPFLWRSSGKFSAPVGEFLDTNPTDINDQGQMPYCNREQILGLTGAKSLSLYSINNHGDIVGMLIFPADSGGVVKGQPIVIQNTGRFSRFGEDLASAWDINDFGVIVGGRNVSQNEGVGILWINGQEYNLNHYILQPSGEKISITSARKINNSGQILCSAYLNGNKFLYANFLLTPVSQKN